MFNTYVWFTHATESLMTSPVSIRVKRCFYQYQSVSKSILFVGQLVWQSLSQTLTDSQPDFVRQSDFVLKWIELGLMNIDDLYLGTVCGKAIIESVYAHWPRQRIHHIHFDRIHKVNSEHRAWQSFINQDIDTLKNLHKFSVSPIILHKSSF